MVEGDVEDSVIFRGVKVQPGAELKQVVALQDCVIGEGAHIECAVLDKEVVVRPGAMLIGTYDHPIIISKGEIV